MSTYDDMAYDGGYRGDEARRVARMLEEEHQRQVYEADYERLASQAWG